MAYIDESILESRKILERQQYSTLETGIYAGEELITFSRVRLLDSAISMMLPNEFIVMPETVKMMKYPSKNAPDWILTSLDSTVNLCFNILGVALDHGDTKEMSNQFQTALRNVNPAIKISRQTEEVTDEGNEMSWFEFIGYALDGQSYNRIYIVKMRDSILHGIFNCSLKDKLKWEKIVESSFLSIKEGAD